MSVRTTTVRSPNAAPEVFAYLGDFANAADRHPEFSESRQLTAGPPTRIGARFHVVVDARSWRTDRVYEVVESIEGRFVALRAQTSSGPTTEVLVVRPARRGCVVRYRTHTRLRGLRAVAGPALALLHHRRTALAGTELRRLLAM